MTALKWRSAGTDRRTADGHYASWSYELLRERKPISGDVFWTAWFYDEAGKPQRLAQGNFPQARAAAINHHNHPGY